MAPSYQSGVAGAVSLARAAGAEITCYKKRMPLKKIQRGKNLITLDGTLDRVAKIAMHIQEKGRNADPHALQITQREAVPEHVECSNPYCHEGGFSLGDIVREMVRARQPEFIGTSFCAGQEGDFEIPATLHSCQTRFEIEIRLQLRP